MRIGGGMRRSARAPVAAFAAGVLLSGLAGCRARSTALEVTIAHPDGLPMDSLELTVSRSGEIVASDVFDGTSFDGETIALWFARGERGSLAIEALASLNGVTTATGSVLAVLVGARRIQTTLLLVAAAGATDAGPNGDSGGTDAGTDAGPPPENCTNGVDDDADGDADCADVDCFAQAGCPIAVTIPFAPEAPGGVDAIPAGCDDCTTGLVPIGFSFVFFGNVRTDVNISSNGFVGFDAALTPGCCDGLVLPVNDAYNDIIAAAWMDLNAFPGAVTYETRGAAPFRRFVVTWDGLDDFFGSVTTQVMLYETTNHVEIHTTRLDPGQIVTQGVENAAGDEALFRPGRVAATFGLMNDGVLFVTF